MQVENVGKAIRTGTIIIGKCPTWFKKICSWKLNIKVDQGGVEQK
jgi:hypothetical protein